VNSTSRVGQRGALQFESLKEPVSPARAVLPPEKSSCALIPEGLEIFAEVVMLPDKARRARLGCLGAAGGCLITEWHRAGYHLPHLCPAAQQEQKHSSDCAPRSNVHHPAAAVGRGGRGGCLAQSRDTGEVREGPW